MYLLIVFITVFGSDRLFLLLAASGSKSPVVDTIEHAPCVPTPHLATPLALVSTAHPLSSFANADVIVPPNVSMAPRPSMLTADGAEELIKGYRKMKKDQNQERWSEDAKKRYEEYQKTWSKFRQTSPKKEKE